MTRTLLTAIFLTCSTKQLGRVTQTVKTLFLALTLAYRTPNTTSKPPRQNPARHHIQ